MSGSGRWPLCVRNDDRGRILKSAETTQVKGTVTLNIGGMELAAELDLKFDTQRAIK